MAGQNPETIKSPARFPTLIDANGYESTIVSMKPGQNQQKVDVYDIIINPHDMLVKKENIKPEERNDQGLYKFSMPCDMVVQLNPDPMWPTWFCLKTIKGEETIASKRLLGTSQQKEIMQLKKEVMIANAKVDFWKERVHLSDTNSIKHFEKYALPYLTKMAPAMKEMMSSDKKDK